MGGAAGVGDPEGVDRTPLIALSRGSLQTSRRMTPREADIVYALEGIDEIEALFAVAPLGATTGGEKNVEVVVQVRAHSARAQGRVGARLATEFEGGELPFVLFVESTEMSTPRFMHRTTALALSPIQREEARARSGLRQMRREANIAMKSATPKAKKIAPRQGRPCIGLMHEWSSAVQRALAKVDAEVRLLPAFRNVRLEYALAEIESKEVDLLVLDAQAAWDHGRRLLSAMASSFGDLPRDHLLIVEEGRPSWATQLMTHYPSLSLPSELSRLPSLLEKATRWRRIESDPFPAP